MRHSAALLPQKRSLQWGRLTRGQGKATVHCSSESAADMVGALADSERRGASTRSRVRHHHWRQCQVGSLAACAGAVRARAGHAGVRCRSYACWPSNMQQCGLSTQMHIAVLCRHACSSSRRPVHFCQGPFAPDLVRTVCRSQFTPNPNGITLRAAHFRASCESLKVELEDQADLPPGAV